MHGAFYLCIHFGIPPQGAITLADEPSTEAGGTAVEVCPLQPLPDTHTHTINSLILVHVLIVDTH